MSFAYDVFGALRSGGGGNNWRFTGEQFDPGSDFYYLRARYYDPAVGRFLTQDPFRGVVLNPSTQSRYPYALNEPIANVDPSGYCVPDFWNCPKEGLELGCNAAPTICDTVTSLFGGDWRSAVLVADLLPLAEACATVVGPGAIFCAGAEGVIGTVAFAITLDDIQDSDCGTVDKLVASAGGAASWAADLGNIFVPIVGEAAELALFEAVGQKLEECEAEGYE